MLRLVTNCRRGGNLRAITLAAVGWACGACQPPGSDRIVATVAFDGPVASVGRARVEGPSGTTWVEYGLTPAYGHRAQVHEGQAALLGLKPERAYYWRVVVEREGPDPVTGMQVFHTPALPEDLPPFELEVRDAARSEVDDGFVVTSVYDPKVSFVVILDGDGDIVWWIRDPGPPWKINRARPSLDGRSIVWSRYDRSRLADIGTIERLALDGSWGTVTRAVEQHHDFVEHEDGTFAWLSWAYTEASLLPQQVPTVYDLVREVAEGADDAVEPRVAFDLLEDSSAAFDWMCSHNLEGVYIPGYRDWSHANSIVHAPASDRWYVQVRYHDALLAIDRATGEMLWALGGPYGEFDAPSPDDLPKHAHLSDAWDGGFLAFDNQDHASRHSRVVEYAYDEESRTVWPVWEYADPEGRYAAFLGDARRLPGGNRLISWSPFGELTEVTPEGDVVWSSKHPFTVSRVTPLWELGMAADLDHAGACAMRGCAPERRTP